MSLIVATEDNHAALEELLRALAGRAAFALIGSGSSHRLGYPLWPELLRRLHEQVGRDRPDTAGELAAIERTIHDDLWRAERYRALLGDGFAAAIRSTFGPTSPPHLPFHEQLVRLPFAHVLTTNYDLSLESAHRAAFGEAPVVTDWRIKVQARAFVRGLARRDLPRHYVYLHGRVVDPDQIVLTDSSYVAEYVRGDMAPFMSAIFALNTLVAIGFSLKDPDLMSLLREIRVRLGEGSEPHFALLPLEEPDDSPHVRTFFRRKYDVEPVFYRATPDHAGLDELVRRLSTFRR